MIPCCGGSAASHLLLMLTLLPSLTTVAATRGRRWSVEEERVRGAGPTAPATVAGENSPRLTVDARTGPAALLALLGSPAGRRGAVAALLAATLGLYTAGLPASG